MKKKGSVVQKEKNADLKRAKMTPLGEDVDSKKR